MYRITNQSQLFILPRVDSETKLRTDLRSLLKTKELAVKRAHNDLVSLEVFKHPGRVLDSFGKVSKYTSRTKRFYVACTITNLSDFEFKLIEQDLMFRMVKSYCHQFSENQLHLGLFLIYDTTSEKEGFGYGIFLEDCDFDELLPSLRKICHDMAINTTDTVVVGCVIGW